MIGLGKQPLCNLYVSMLQRFGVEVESSASATGHAAELRLIRDPVSLRMMIRAFAVLLASFLPILASPPSRTDFLQTYCNECHGAEEAEGRPAVRSTGAAGTEGRRHSIFRTSSIS